MLNTRYCRHCKKLAEIVRWEKDNPVLSCGHTKQRVSADDRVAECARDIQRAASKEAAKTGLSERTITDVFLHSIVEDWVRANTEDARIGWCSICEQTVTCIELDGELVCGGDLLKNPGCGCRLQSKTAPTPPLKCG